MLPVRLMLRRQIRCLSIFAAAHAAILPLYAYAVPLCAPCHILFTLPCRSVRDARVSLDDIIFFFYAFSSPCSFRMRGAAAEAADFRDLAMPFAFFSFFRLFFRHISSLLRTGRLICMPQRRRHA